VEKGGGVKESSALKVPGGKGAEQSTFEKSVLWPEVKVRALSGQVGITRDRGMRGVRGTQLGSRPARHTGYSAAGFVSKGVIPSNRSHILRGLGKGKGRELAVMNSNHMALSWRGLKGVCTPLPGGDCLEIKKTGGDKSRMIVSVQKHRWEPGQIKGQDDLITLLKGRCPISDLWGKLRSAE